MRPFSYGSFSKAFCEWVVVDFELGNILILIGRDGYKFSDRRGPRGNKLVLDVALRRVIGRVDGNRRLIFVHGG